jgi:hypothetical protein
MAELQQYASDEKPVVFDGKYLHKRAFTRKGKPQAKDAALVAGAHEEEMDGATTALIIARMMKVKKGFQGKVEHYVKNWWVETARRIGMRLEETGKLVETYEEMSRELESNPRMESFQNWYNICYKETEIKSSGKRDAESKILKDLKVQYHDKTTVDGCVGIMLAEVMSKQLEYIQTRARTKMRLHLVKSRPSGAEKGGGIPGGQRRGTGMYYIIESAKNGKMIEYTAYNVSPVWCGIAFRDTYKLTPVKYVLFVSFIHIHRPGK